MTLNKLFLQKLLVAFVVGFAGSFAVFVTGLAQSPSFSFETSVWMGALVAAIIAGARAVLVLLPGVNLVPSDAQSPVNPAPPKPAAPPAA